MSSGVVTVADWLRAVALAAAASTLDRDKIAEIVAEVDGDPVRLRGLLLAYLACSRPVATSTVPTRAVAAEFDDLVAGLSFGGGLG